MQTHATECGAACLGSILAYFGRWIPFTDLRSRCEVSRDGSTAAAIARAAKYYGLDCKGWHGELRSLRTLPLPLVLFWEFNHFLILEGFDRDHFYLNDPATGRRKLTEVEFGKSFTGVALRFGKGPEFRPGGIRFSVLRRLPDWFDGAWGAVAFAMGCGLSLSALALATPATLAVFVDQVLGEGAPWGGVLGGVLAVAAVLVYALTWLKKLCLSRLAVRISVIAGNRCLTRLLRLPVDYFGHRLVGELTSRVQSIDRIAKGLADRFLGVLIEVAMSVVFLVVMLVYDAVLAGLVFGLAVLNAMLVWMIARRRADETHTWRREQGLLLGVGTLMLHQSDSLRMTADADDFFVRWSAHHARELAARQKFAQLGHANSAMPGLFLVLGSAVVLAVGAAEVMAGQWTLGGLVGFYIVAAMFLDPVGRFVEFSDERQALETDMQRLDDILETGEDRSFACRTSRSNTVATVEGRLRFAGRVELRGMTFGYNRAKPPLLKDLHLVIEPGQRIAVVGPSGSGKSTLARLVAGIHQPWSGEILFDGLPRHDIPEEVLSRSLSMVDQEAVLFSGTVRDNICLWNPAFPDEAVVAAARDACIHDEILARARGYETDVDEDGANFSGGQRQRLGIARALVGGPTVLILDEATSALDASTEERVDDALRRRGVSCLIVAHRLSTFRDCDQIIVLDKGEEVQRGTHGELMADDDGTYARLVRVG